MKAKIAVGVVIALIALSFAARMIPIYRATGRITTDIDFREVVRDGKTCKEYYALKDGLPLKTVCPP